MLDLPPAPPTDAPHDVVIAGPRGSSLRVWLRPSFDSRRIFIDAGAGIVLASERVRLCELRDAVAMLCASVSNT